jgi:hypothetical protein
MGFVSLFLPFMKLEDNQSESRQDPILKPDEFNLRRTICSIHVF